jgi:hypothetical protein
MTGIRDNLAARAAAAQLTWLDFVIIMVAVKSYYSYSLTMAKEAKAKCEAAEDDEIAWTVRMSRSLAKRIRAHAEALTDEGRGKWSGNMVIVTTLADAAKGW